MMFPFNDPTKRASVLNGVLFRTEAKRSADTVWYHYKFPVREIRLILQ